MRKSKKDLGGLSKAELLEEIERLQSVLDSTSASIFAFDEHFNYTVFNKAHQEVIKAGRGVELQLGDNYRELAGKNSGIDEDKTVELFNRVLSGQTVETIEEFGEPDLHRAFYSMICNPVFAADGTVKGVTVFCQDISEQKAAEQRLLKAEAELKRTVELLDTSQRINKTGGWEYDVLTGSVYRTKYLKLLSGIPDDTTTVEQAISFYREDGRRRLEEGLKKAIEQQQPYDLELQTIHDDKWLRSIGIPVVKDGKTVKIMGAVMDITAVKHTEAELLKAKQTAESAALAKQQFLSNMSHEIRTPMNAVIGMTHLLLQEDPKAEQIENLKVLKFSSENLLSLINDILDYSKIESGKIVFEETDFNLTELMSSIKHAHQIQADEKGIRFELKMDAALPQILVGDPVRLSQILNNLISNALKFTKKGSVLVTIGLRSADHQSVQLDFGVKDTGIGIEPAVQDYIFESFAQASADTTRRFGGTGLGLAITKKLLQLQGSEVHLISQPGKGSSFSFSLSFKKSEKKSARAYHGQTSQLQNLGGYKVLLAEDNEINTKVALKFMEKWGLQVDLAGTGTGAVEKVKQNEYHLVLMDLQMPVMDGYKASVKIRALKGERFQKIPIIALTASAFSEVKGKTIEAGMNDYISKPFNPSELYGKIVQYLFSD
ncbi:ATP-binding protein [Pedobacter nutrimenti]|uniref:Sensory/regulatory protein RpfC n=1 Tax=Pedobacter nutrimenti TaxID=1241337 RepID=A0A318UDZ0_9SPHI|nr:ATP-binding protein [Pedobacter nutrimenti]PYF74293.1 PAS domain S-box-containing protein [Pedobacter nutrimenti]